MIKLAFPTGLSVSYTHFQKKRPTPNALAASDELCLRPAHLSIVSLPQAMETLTFTTPVKSHCLLPAATPVLLVHGTFASSNALNSAAKWYAQHSHPVYRSFLPEVQKATGIEFVNEKIIHAPSALPAYILLLRDLGDFRVQLLKPKLKELETLYAQPLYSHPQQLVRYFGLSENWQDVFGPILETWVLNPVFNPPERLQETFHEKSSLQRLIYDAYQKVEHEARKLKPAGALPAIIDSGFFQQETERQNRQNKKLHTHTYVINNDTRLFFVNPAVINTRPLDLGEITRIERYLLAIEEDLTNALDTAFSNRDKLSREQRAALDAAAPDRKSQQQLAEMLSQQIMSTLLPQGLALGHSQGGTVIHTALLHYLLNEPHSLEDIVNRPVPFSSQLSDIRLPSQNISSLLHSAGFIGMTDYRSAPLSGIPDVPEWAKGIYSSVCQIEQTKHLPSLVSRLLKNIGWEFFQHKRPGVWDIKANSPLLQWFSKQNDALEKSNNHAGLTVLSTYDQKDGFIERYASQINHQQKPQSTNVFEIRLNLPQVSSLTSHRSALILKYLSKITKKTRIMYDQLAQHNATMRYPDQVNESQYQYFIENPIHFCEVLSYNNFYPFKAQLLTLWQTRVYQSIQEQWGQDLFGRKLLLMAPYIARCLCQNEKAASPFIPAEQIQSHQSIEAFLDLIETRLNQPLSDAEYRQCISALLIIANHKTLKPAIADQHPK